MKTSHAEFPQFKAYIQEISEEHGWQPSTAFVYFFLRASLGLKHDDAINALTGASGDKSVDAVHFDHENREVNIVQAKYRAKLNGSTEKREDIMTFANLSRLPYIDHAAQKAYLDKMNEKAQSKMRKTIKAVGDDDYTMRFYYVSTGKCSRAHITEAQSVANKKRNKLIFEEGNDIMAIYHDFESELDAPPFLRLRIGQERGVTSTGVIKRLDDKKDMEARIFTMLAKDVAEISSRSGSRLFHKNIRGFLGEDTTPGLGMIKTLKNDPTFFWYFNNGITIICEKSELVEIEGEQFLDVTRPQIINGQQTTKILELQSTDSASVLVRVIKVNPGRSRTQYEGFVRDLVKATNSQNPVSAADLVSNDEIQILLSKKFAQRSYEYKRKKGAIWEEKKYLPKGRVISRIQPTKLARAVAVCDQGDVGALTSIQQLFAVEATYRKIFKDRPINFYLARFWASELAAEAAPETEQTRALWLVLQIFWKEIGKMKPEMVAAFIYSCEKKDLAVLRPGMKALRTLYKISMHFYAKKGRRPDGTKFDLHAFFKSPNLAKSVPRYAAAEMKSEYKTVKISFSTMVSELKKVQKKIKKAG